VIFLGIDPGTSGSIASLNEHGEVMDVIRNKETLATQRDWITYGSQIRLCAIERVGAMPGQGVSSTFKFGRSFGQLEGLIVGLAIPHEFVTPQKWQQAMGCRSKGDKNVTKAAAQRLWPSRKIVHAEADALLLAEWARRTWHERNGRAT